MTTTLDRTTAPLPGAPRPYHFPQVTRKTLDNGLKILVAESHNAPLVSFRTLVRSGADQDSADVAGLASMTAELLDEGAGARDGVQIAEDAGLLGASIAAGADWDASYVSMDVLSRNVDPSVDIFADLIRRPTFPNDELERVRTERLMELLQQRNEPAAIAGKRFANLLYGSGAYGNSATGNSDSVGRMTADAIRQFYEANYTPNHAPFVDSVPERSEVTRESVDEVLYELRHIRTGDVETRKLDETNNSHIGVFPAMVQTASDDAGRLLNMELYGLAQDYFDRYRENI